MAPAVLVHGHRHGHEHGVLELLGQHHLGRVHVVVGGRHRRRAHVLGDSPAVVTVAALVAAPAGNHRLHERVRIHFAAVQICFQNQVLKWFDSVKICTSFYGNFYEMFKKLEY